MPASKKKPKEKLPLKPCDDTPKIDWEKLDTFDIPQATKEQWYNSAAEAVRNEDLESFKAVLKSIQPISSLVHLFQQHWNDDIADFDIIKIAVVGGNKAIVDCMMVVVGEAKFHQLAKWGPHWAIHIAAIWGHVQLVELFHEYHTEHGGDPLGIEGQTVRNMANRYHRSSIVEYYDWCDLRTNYIRVLRSLVRHLKKAFPQQEPEVFTADDLDRYQAGCEEKIGDMKTAKFNVFHPRVLRQAIDEACELRFKVKTFLPKEDLPKGKARRGARGNKEK